MRWQALSNAVHVWFAEAWSRGRYATAADLGWIAGMIDCPNLAVSEGLRILLDAADDGATDPASSVAPNEKVLDAMARDLRRAIEQHAHLAEPPARYGSASRDRGRRGSHQRIGSVPGPITSS